MAANQGNQTARDGYWTVAPYGRLPPPAGDPYLPGKHSHTRLFNLEADEREEHNLAGDPAQQARVANMMARLQNYWASKAHGYVPDQVNFPHPLANPQLHKWTWSPWLPSW